LQDRKFFFDSNRRYNGCRADNVFIMPEDKEIEQRGAAPRSVHEARIPKKKISLMLQGKTRKDAD